LGHKSLLITQHYVELYGHICGNNKPERFIIKIAEPKEEWISLFDEGWTFKKRDEEN